LSCLSYMNDCTGNQIEGKENITTWFLQERRERRKREREREIVISRPKQGDVATNWCVDLESNEETLEK
jgi:hypothetical protein